MNAALAPIRARAVRSVDTLCENAASTENTEKAKSAHLHDALATPTVREPPAARASRPANGNEYPSTIHCSDEFDACRSREIVGSATLTMVLSTTIEEDRDAENEQHQPSPFTGKRRHRPPKMSLRARSAVKLAFGLTEHSRPYPTDRAYTALANQTFVDEVIAE